MWPHTNFKPSRLFIHEFIPQIMCVIMIRTSLTKSKDYLVDFRSTTIQSDFARHLAWYVLWVGVEMFLKKAQTLWLAVYLSSSSLSLHTKIQKKKKIMVDVREIDGCRFEILFYLLIFWYYKIMVLGKIRDYWN